MIGMILMKFIIPALFIVIIVLDSCKKINITSKKFMFIFSLFIPHVIFFGYLLNYNTLFLKISSILLCCIFILYCLFRINFLTVQKEEEVNTRVKILHSGYIILRCSLISLLTQLFFYFILLPNIILEWQIPRWIIISDSIAAVVYLIFIMLNGSIRILFTCRRLGLIKRLLIIINFWIPILNLFLMLYMCRIAREEYDHECYKVECQNIRIHSMVCHTKYPLLMVHGIGFKDLKYFNYWGRIPKSLIKNGAVIYYGHQEGWGTIEDNAKEIQKKIFEILKEQNVDKVNIIAHSKGGLDARYMIHTYNMGKYVASLTTIATPHMGSEIINVLMYLPDSIYQFICKQIDKMFLKFGDKNPQSYIASRQLSVEFAEQFNQTVLDSPEVFYQSYASVMKNFFSDFLLCIPYFILKKIKGANDGLVCVNSAKWGTFHSIVCNKYTRGISHGDLIDLKREDYKGFDITEKYIEIISNLKESGF